MEASDASIEIPRRDLPKEMRERVAPILRGFTDLLPGDTPIERLHTAGEGQWGEWGSRWKILLGDLDPKDRQILQQLLRNVARPEKMRKLGQLIKLETQKPLKI